MTATATLQKKLAANLGRLAADWAKKVAPGAAILGGTAGAAALATRGGHAANPLRATGVPPGASVAAAPEVVAPEAVVAPKAEPGLLDKVKTMGGDAIDAAKDWAGKTGPTGFTHGTEAAAVGGTLSAGALLAYLLRKKKQPQHKMAGTAFNLGRTLGTGIHKAKSIINSAPAKAVLGITGLGAAASLGYKGMKAPVAPAAAAPAAEPGLWDKTKEMAGNAWDATKTWAGEPGYTGLGMNKGTEAGALAAGGLLAYLLRKNKKPADDE